MFHRGVEQRSSLSLFFCPFIHFFFESINSLSVVSAKVAEEGNKTQSDVDKRKWASFVEPITIALSEAVRSRRE